MLSLLNCINSCACVFTYLLLIFLLPSSSLSSSNARAGEDLVAATATIKASVARDVVIISSFTGLITIWMGLFLAYLIAVGMNNWPLDFFKVVSIESFCIGLIDIRIDPLLALLIFFKWTKYCFQAYWLLEWIHTLHHH